MTAYQWLLVDAVLRERLGGNAGAVASSEFGLRHAVQPLHKRFAQLLDLAAASVTVTEAAR
jgi:hypothetical protein